jgi:hypothetical protein
MESSPGETDSPGIKDFVVVTKRFTQTITSYIMIQDII